MSHIYFFTLSFVLTTSFCLFWLKIGLTDDPSKGIAHKKHHRIVVTSAGIPLFCAILIILIIHVAFPFWAIKPSFGLDGGWFMILAMAAFTVLGSVDDFYNLSAKLKIILFSLSSLWIAAALPLPFNIWMFGTDDVQLSLSILSVIISALGYFFLINAINFIDGADGLAFGQLLAILMVVLGLDIYYSKLDNGPFLLLIIGAITAFMLFNKPRALLYAGDSGSLAFGFVTLALIVQHLQENTIPPGLLFLSFLPIASDVLSTLAWRYRRGKKLTEGHRDHFYQLLIRTGQPVWQITLGYILVTFICCMLSILIWPLPIWVQFVFALLCNTLAIFVLFHLRNRLFAAIFEN